MLNEKVIDEDRLHDVGDMEVKQPQGNLFFGESFFLSVSEALYHCSVWHCGRRRPWLVVEEAPRPAVPRLCAIPDVEGAEVLAHCLFFAPVS